MTQRRLEVESERLPPVAQTEPEGTPVPEAPGPPPTSPTPPRSPSGDSLRERQARWLAERARFESRSKARPPESASSPEGTK